jgi:hypothetical protein
MSNYVARIEKDHISKDVSIVFYLDNPAKDSRISENPDVTMEAPGEGRKIEFNF